MDYVTALKKVQARKPKGNFMVITNGYDLKMVLPHADGMAFMASISNAEQLFDPYNEKHRIGPLNRDKLTVSIMSQHEYEQYKVAALLNLDVKEIKEMAGEIEP